MHSQKNLILLLILFTFFSGSISSISTAQNIAEPDSVSTKQTLETTPEPVADVLNQRLSQLNAENVQNKISFERQLELAKQIIRYDYAALILTGIFIGISTRKRARKNHSQKI
jgi:hypothetical protein